MLPDRPDNVPNIDVGAFEQGTEFSRWALARYIVGRVILERVSWALLGVAVVLLVLSALCEWGLDSTFLAVVLFIVAIMVLLVRWVLITVLHRLMGAQAYGPLEKHLDAIISGATRSVLLELRRVGLPSRLFTIPIIAFRLVGRRRPETLEKMRAFDVDRAVPKARRDELHLLLQEATGRPVPGPRRVSDPGPGPWPPPYVAPPGPSAPPVAASPRANLAADVPIERRGAEGATVADARFAMSLTAALMLLGALLGLLWAVWTPSGPAAQIFPGGGFLTDETTEGVIAADGRYLAIVAVAGVVTALTVWTQVRFRGPLTMLALGGGGMLGACVMQVVGGLAGGGTYAGRRFTVSGTAYEVTKTLPLDVRATGLVFVWPALAALVYGMLTAFAVRDDLGRPDPVRDALVPPRLVDPGADPQRGGGYGDAPGALQQRYLPPQ